MGQAGRPPCHLGHVPLPAVGHQHLKSSVVIFVFGSGLVQSNSMFFQLQEGIPPHHLGDLPLLALAAFVAALRRPARRLLPTTAVLYCARCAGEVASAALRSQEGALALAAGERQKEKKKVTGTQSVAPSLRCRSAHPLLPCKHLNGLCTRPPSCKRQLTPARTPSRAA